MATAETTKGPIDDPDQIRERWLDRLRDLIATVQAWAEEMDWVTRVIEVNMKDSLLGKYKAPALLFQQGKARIFLEPIGWSSIGSEGIVDLYLMPGYDDVANLICVDGAWHLRFRYVEFPDDETVLNADLKPLTKESLREVLEEMVRQVG